MVKFLCSFRTIKYPQISWCGIRVILQIAIDVEKKAPLSSRAFSSPRPLGSGLRTEQVTKNREAQAKRKKKSIY